MKEVAEGQVFNSQILKTVSKVLNFIDTSVHDPAPAKLFSQSAVNRNT